MAQRTTIYIPDDLQRKIDDFKRQNPDLTLNISAICERAIRKRLISFDHEQKKI